MSSALQLCGQDSEALSSAISPISEIIEDIRTGKMVVLVDEEDRENEGDLVMAAEFVTPQAINFMVTHARGLVCLTLTHERCRQLNLPLMAEANGAAYGTNFTVSIEAAEGVHTGISVADRAHTIRTAVAADAKPEDLVQPGHIFPVRAVPGGVLVRAGHTEAGCDLTALAGLTPAAVICEILRPDGTMARLPDLIVYCREHALKIGTIADLIQYRSEHESVVRRIADKKVKTAWGEFDLSVYQDTAQGRAHIALTHGTPVADQETLVRVHEPTTLIDVLASNSDTHSWGFDDAMRAIAHAKAGVAVLLNVDSTAKDVLDQASRMVQPQQTAHASHPTRSTDLRTYGIGAQILRDLGVGKMRLLARPRKMPSMMAGFGLVVTGYDEAPALKLNAQEDA
jgi:3,4-dihydroxy 2-butanone 4-phosphate synthase / GTP cyclohydrolase II